MVAVDLGFTLQGYGDQGFMIQLSMDQLFTEDRFGLMVFGELTHGVGVFGCPDTGPKALVLRPELALFS